MSIIWEHVGYPEVSRLGFKFRVGPSPPPKTRAGGGRRPSKEGHRRKEGRAIWHTKGGAAVGI